MSALDPSAAAALVAAAVAAVGPCPADPDGAAAWDRKVRDRAEALATMVPVVAERLAVLAEAKLVTGVIVSVRDVKGRAVITTRPTMGKRGADGEIIRKSEDLRTDWLASPAGAEMAARARSLVGRHCRFGKRVEPKANGTGESVAVCEWIEDLGPNPDAPATSGSATAVSGNAVPRPASPASGPVALCSDTYRKAILSMARQLLVDEAKRDTFARWRTAAGIPVLNDPTLTAEQAARVRTFLAGMYDQVGGAA